MICDVCCVTIILFQNAFSKRLGSTKFDIFQALPVDFLHEVELGVWKSLLEHLLRILDAQDESLKHEFDRRSVYVSDPYVSLCLLTAVVRCRLLPPFGQEIIRKIYTNRSELSKMTAHEYAELLKVRFSDTVLPDLPHRLLPVRYTVV